MHEAVDMLGERDDMLFLDLDAGKEALGYDPREEFCIDPLDCHSNTAGHRVIAQILSEYLTQKGLID